jgi:tetratricopeptide (TPR) repeat protein
MNGVLSAALALALELGPGLRPAAGADLEESGREHLYNMELSSARETFTELARSEPHSPAGPYYEATTLWMGEFTRRGGMSGATFRTSDYWSSSREEAPDPSLDRDFKRLVQETITRADDVLKTLPDDEDALYFRGGAEGLMSAYLASVERSYYGAYQAGKRAKEYHERLLKLDPDYADACLLPGIFEYTIATLPRSVRFLGFLVGIRGSKEKGISLVERAVEKGVRTRWVARLSMSILNERERRYGDALGLLGELERAFPRNPFFTMERGSVHLLQKDWLAARRAFEEVVADRDRLRGGDAESYRLLPESLVFLRLGESYLFAKSYDQATRELDRALGTPGVPDWVRAQTFLRRGMCSDARGQRVAAEWDYRRVLKLDTDSVVSELAERYLDKPYGKE